MIEQTGLWHILTLEDVYDHILELNFPPPRDPDPSLRSGQAGALGHKARWCGLNSGVCHSITLP